MKYLKTLLVSGCLPFLAMASMGPVHAQTQQNGNPSGIISPEPIVPPTNSLPTVSVVATDAEAAEFPVNGVTNTAVFTISRTGPTTNDLAVFLILGGSASYGLDYTATPLLLPPTPSATNAVPYFPVPQVVIPAGASNVQLTIWPLNDDSTNAVPTSVRFREGVESVVVQLEPPIIIVPYAGIATNPLPPFPLPPIPPAYNIDPTAASATALILDNDPFPTNLPPVVTITGPASNAVFTLPTNIEISASVTDNSANIRYVAFFANDWMINVQSGTTNSVYTYNWTGIGPGSYNLTVVAWDFLDARGESAPVGITVNPPTPVPAGQLFNVNFGGGNKTGFAAAGLGTNDVWNVIDGSSVTWSNLVMAGSSSSPITVEIHNAGGHGANGSGDAMYDSYVFPTNSAPSSANSAGTASPRPIYLSLQGVPFGKYDLYLYGHADALPGLENDSVFQAEAAGQNFGPLGTVSSSGWQSTDPWQDGVQYVAFRDVMVGLEGTVQIQVLAGFNGQPTADPRHAAVLNGLQLLSKDPSASNAPPTITLVAPTNGSIFQALTNIVLTANAEDIDGVVSRVDFFEGTRWLGGKKLIGSVNGNSSSNLISFTWSNVLSGNYVITARATDDGGKTAASDPVKITVSEIDTLPVVNIAATERYAVEPSSNSVVKTGAFTVYRSGDASNPLMVFYSIGGTASNGVDYAQLPRSLTIPAGANSAAITIKAIDDNDTNEFETVVLTLTASPAASPVATYAIGYHSRDVVYILDKFPFDPPAPDGASQQKLAATVASDGSGHLAVAGSEGDFVVVEVSSDLKSWTYLAHGLIVGGQLQFVDPNATGDLGRFYRSRRP